MNEAMTAAELKAELAAIKAMLPNERADVTVGVHCPGGMSVGVYPEGMAEKPCKFFPGYTFAEAFAAAREWCAAYPDQRRAEVERKLAEVERKLAEAQAELAALGGVVTASLPVEIHHGVEG